MKTDQSFLTLLCFSQAEEAHNSLRIGCLKMQPSLSACAVKSPICVSHSAAQVLCHHFSSLDESSLVLLTSVLNIAWKSISQACAFDHIIPLHIFLLVFPSLLSSVLKLLVRHLNIIYHLSCSTKTLVSCPHNANLRHLVITLGLLLCVTSFPPGKY